MLPSSAAVRVPVSRELILARRHNQLQPFAAVSQRIWPHSFACPTSSFLVSAPTSTGPSKSRHESTSSSGSSTPMACSRLMIACTPGNEVDARHQRAAVDPLLTGMPAFHRRRIEQVLAHIGGLHRQLAIARHRYL